MRKTVVLTLLLTLLATFALAHGGHGHVMGTVAALTADHIEVKTKEGKTVSVPLAKTTKFLKGHQAAKAADAKVGSRVAVHLGADGAAVEVHLPGTAKVP